MHWAWKNYLFAWQGLYKGQNEECSFILEAVADHDQWIWHSFFGMAGNTMTSMYCSDLLCLQDRPSDILIRLTFRSMATLTPKGITTPTVSILVGLLFYDNFWTNYEEAILVYKISRGSSEGCSAGIWCASGAFTVVRYPTLTWSESQMWEMINCYVILHNMIIKSERAEPDNDYAYDYIDPLAQLDDQVPAQFSAFLIMHMEIHNAQEHHRLQTNLVENIWSLKRNT
jgi:hypothetical protein